MIVHYNYSRLWKHGAQAHASSAVLEGFGEQHLGRSEEKKLERRSGFIAYDKVGYHHFNLRRTHTHRLFFFLFFPMSISFVIV